MTLRVLHLTDSWGPGRAETVYADLCVGLDPARFESHCGLPRGTGWLYEEIRRRGSLPLVFPAAGAFNIRHVARLVRCIRDLRIDVLQAHTFGTSVYASLAGFIARVPVVCTLHGRVDIALEDRHRTVKWQIIRTGASAVVCVSESLRAELLATTRGLRADRVRVIYNGVDVDHYRPGRDLARRGEFGVGTDDVLVGAVGNVRRIKGYEVLVAASALLQERGVPCRVVVAGQADNDVHEELRRQSEELGVSRIIQFAGFRTDVAELFRAFDVYAITSHSEGFPLSTIQAMASGLPVVATRCGGPEEMVNDGEEGWLAERGSARSVADALERLIGDPVARRRMGSAARQAAVSRFSTAAMISEYEALYEGLVGRRRPLSAAKPALRAMERREEPAGKQ